MTLALAIAGVMLIALLLYTLTGGADFGGGVWDLLAFGKRARAQRELIAREIAPVWEANHVWLVLLVVLLFVAFPSAYAAVSTALYIPLFIMLIGIVLRGTTFVFRAYGKPTDAEERFMGTLFGITSLCTPVMLGVVLGAVSGGRVRLDPTTGRAIPEFISSWCAPYPFAVGFFVLTLFAFLAAVYLTATTRDEALGEDFRARALGAAAALGVTALVALFVADDDAVRIYEGLAGTAAGILVLTVTSFAAAGAVYALWTRRYRLARTLAMAQTTLFVVGFGLAQYPYVVVPDITFTDAAAPDSVLRSLLGALALGAVLLFPAFAYLYSLFAFHGQKSDPPPP